MTGFEILIVVIGVLCLAGLYAALAIKAVGVVKKAKAFRAEKQLLESNDGYVVDIVQNGKTVHIVCNSAADDSDAEEE